MQKIKEFLLSNYIPLIFFVLAVVIELTGVAVSSGRFYIKQPVIWLSILLLLTSVQFLIKNQRFRYLFSLFCLIAIFVFDLVFLVIFDMNGTIFDFSMLQLRKDAMGILDSIPINFLYFAIAGTLITLFAFFTMPFAKRAPRPSRGRTQKIVVSIILCLSILFQGGSAYFVCRPLAITDPYSKLYGRSDGSYSDKGIIGNFISEMYRSQFYKTDPGDVNDLTRFVYENVSQPTEMFGTAEGYNVVTVLCESFEWFSFISDAYAYPNGHTANKEILRSLYPNLYKFMDDSIVMNNYHSREKTDISENLSIIGNYPLDYYINYDYPDNDIPYSMPNLFKTLYGADVNSFHNGNTNFYNRNHHHTGPLGFDSFTASESMAGDKFTNYMAENGEYNLDSEMIRACRDEMFPTDRRFYTYITTITMHGAYSHRSNIDKHYDKLDELGLLPEKSKPQTDYLEKNYFRTYAAAAMELDAALGEIDAALEEKGLKDNTMVVLFGDHNAYYHSLTNYVKNIDIKNSGDRNATDLYKVPLMIRIGDGEVKRTVDKFACTADIVPTLLDLAGIHFYSNLCYGHSVFDEEESVLYSRAYNIFITDKLLFTTINNIVFRAPDADDEYLSGVERRSLALLDKVSSISRIFAGNYFDGAAGDEYLKRMLELNGLNAL